MLPGRRAMASFALNVGCNRWQATTTLAYYTSTRPAAKYCARGLVWSRRFHGTWSYISGRDISDYQTRQTRLSNAEEEHDAFCRVLPLWLHH